MNITLWLLQILLAAAFLAHGWLLVAPPPEIAAQMNAQLSRAFWVFLGVAEILAGVGLTLPGITRIMPWLVPSAAVGLIIVMVAATIWHLARAEFSAAAITTVLLGMAAFTGYGRWRIAPIRSKRSPAP